MAADSTYTLKTREVVHSLYLFESEDMEGIVDPNPELDEHRPLSSHPAAPVGTWFVGWVAGAEGAPPSARRRRLALREFQASPSRPLSPPASGKQALDAAPAPRPANPLAQERCLLEVF